MKQFYPQRKILRLTTYDYAQNGAYFITICTENRTCLFGEVLNDAMVLNDAGKMIEMWYWDIESRFPTMQCDSIIVMPNHVHFTIFSVGADRRVRPSLERQTTNQHETILPEHPRAGGHTGPPLQRILQWFKTMTTNVYIDGVKTKGWQPFEGKVWQRGYYDQIVKNEAHLQSVRQYIENNPAQWALDEENQNKP